MENEKDKTVTVKYAPETIWIDADFATKLMTTQPRYGASIEYRRADQPGENKDNKALAGEVARLTELILRMNQQRINGLSLNDQKEIAALSGHTPEQPK